MAALLINSTSAIPSFFDTFHPEGKALVTAPLRKADTSVTVSSGFSVNDSVTLSRKATHQLNSPASRQEINYSQDIFTSYVDLLQQQRRAQTMIRGALAGSGGTSNGQTSMLNSYQTLQYRQSMYDRTFNLKTNIFQSILDITA